MCGNNNKCGCESKHSHSHSSNHHENHSSHHHGDHSSHHHGNHSSNHHREHSPKRCDPCHKKVIKCVVVECKPVNDMCCNSYCDSRMSCKSNVDCHLAQVGSSKEMYIKRYRLENVAQNCPGDC